MYLSTPTGQDNVESVEQLLLALQRRHKEKLASFWMDHHEYPVLFLGINDQLAWLNYIPGNEKPGFLSQGDMPDSLPEIEFLDMDGHVDLRPASCVVPLSVAVQAVTAFFLDESLPENVKWLEL